MEKRLFAILLLAFTFMQIYAVDDDERWTNYVVTSGTAGVVTHEDYPNLFDNDTNTKWCVTNVSSTIYVEFDAKRPIHPTGYVLTTAIDTQSVPERNPKSWVIKGRNTIRGNWTTLATITDGAMPTGNGAFKTFALDTNSAYRYYRFEVTTLVGGNIFQLSEFYFLVNDINDDTIDNDDTPIDEEDNVLILGSNGSSPLFADCPLDSVFIGRNISYPTSSDKGYSPFYRNTSLRSIHITNVETEISPNEFYGCTNLKNVRLGDGITTIGYWAFSGCSSIDYFSFGTSMKDIEKEAFSDCTAMTKLISRAVTPPTCGEQALDDIRKWDCTLIVPQGYVAAYRDAPQWKEFLFVEEGEKPEVHSYTLTYMVDDVVYKVYEKEENTPITAEAEPTKDGYTFSGWSLIPQTMPAKDVTITGSFTINSYKLTYMVDGEQYKSVQVKYGAAIVPEAEPTKEGYNFSGWDLIPQTMPAKDVTITGSFTINSYKLTYIVDDEQYKSVQLKYGAAITPEAEPTKEGYTFSGWSLIPQTMPAKDVTITGTFTMGQYKLTYMVDGETYKTVSMDFGAPIIMEEYPTKEGYTFSGWSEIPESMPAKDVTITGSFNINSYKLTYLVDGEEYKSVQLKYGAAITPEAEPTNEGYTFSGWNLIPQTMPAKDVTITGSFTVNSYKLVYMVDGEEYKSVQVTYGAAITPEAEPIKEGYTFSGWDKIPTTMPAQNLKVTGFFTINNYKLIYIVDGEEYKTVNVVYGASITAEAAPSKEGYSFSGWGEMPAKMPANDVTVTGSFTINKYTLAYVVDGEQYKSVQVSYGTTITPEAEPTKEGYTFSGWSLIPETMPAKDVTITGVFTKGQYKLTYFVDGQTYKTFSMDFGTPIIAEEYPTKEGYTFSGWDEIPSTMPAKDVNVIGSFTINSYKLAYIVDGEEYKIVNVAYGSSITAEAEPTKDGYTFSGWKDVPATMPAEDVTITGTFNVNSYKLTYMVDGDEYKTVDIEYGAVITPEAEPIKEGYTFSGWDLIPETMPAHDVTTTGTFTFVDAIDGIIADEGEYQIYTLDGKQIESLQKGVNIIRFSNGQIKKVFIK